MTKVLSLQEKSNRLVKQGIKYLDKIEGRTRKTHGDQSVLLTFKRSLNGSWWNFGATSCVYRATMEHLREGASFEVKDILTELSSLFTNVIDMVKDKCDLKTPLEDQISVMIRSAALKTPIISTQLLPAIQMTANKILAEVTKVLQSNKHIPFDQSFTVDVVAIK